MFVITAEHKCSLICITAYTNLIKLDSNGFVTLMIDNDLRGGSV